MKWLLGVLGLVITAGAIVVWLFLPTAQVGAAYAAKAVCSGVFVSGLDAERAFDEEVARVDPALGYAGYSVDRDAGVVSASIVGLGRRQAVYREGTGCTLAIGGDPDPISIVAARSAPAPLPERGLPIEAEETLEAALDNAFAEPVEGSPLNTRAILVTHKGDVIAERYAAGVDSATPLKGWSMNKTLVGLTTGLLAERGWIDPDARAPVADWADPADPRHAIPLRHLLTMTSGLDFDESYGNMNSDVVQMLFNSRSAASRAASSTLAHEPGEHWSYSSGTTNIISRIARETLAAHGVSLHDFIQTELFAPLGVTTATLETDSAGDFVGSSFGYMSAHDWARVGALFATGGRGPNGEQVVSPEWIAYMTTDNGLSGGQYGAQVWLNRPDATTGVPAIANVPTDLVYLSGHDGQMVAAIPSRDLVVVRLGESSSWGRSAAGDLIEAIVQVVDALPSDSPTSEEIAGDPSTAVVAD